MELRHLRYFVAVAEELHFGRAAEKLHMSQPPLSHQIRDLERELGVDLFHRTRHFVAMTEAGRLFLEEARHILGEAEHAMFIARRAGRGEINRVAIGSGPTAEEGVLKKILSAFLSRHPDALVDLSDMYSQKQIEALAARRIDVAFPLLPVSHRELVVETIGSEPFVAALPAGHKLVGQERLGLADLRHEQFALVSRSVGSNFHELVVRACGQAGFIPYVALDASHVMTELGFVAAGLGVSIVPNPLRYREVEGVAFRDLYRAPSVDVGVAYRRDNTSKTLLEFLEVVRDVTRPKSFRAARAPTSA